MGSDEGIDDLNDSAPLAARNELFGTSGHASLPHQKRMTLDESHKFLFQIQDSPQEDSPMFNKKGLDTECKPITTPTYVPAGQHFSEVRSPPEPGSKKSAHRQFLFEGFNDGKSDLSALTGREGRTPGVNDQWYNFIYNNEDDQNLDDQSMMSDNSKFTLKSLKRSQSNVAATLPRTKK